MRRLWRKFAYGDGQPPNQELRETDPARFGGLEANRRAARRAAAILILTTLASAVAIVLAALFTGDIGLGVVFGITGTAFGLAANSWWTARGARQADSQRVVDLARGIFLQDAQVLRRMINPYALDGILQNLLNTVMPDEDLGDSLWQQGFGTLVERVRNNRWRVGQRYDVELRERGELLTVSLPDGHELGFEPVEWRELRAELSYTRSFEAKPRHLWVGLVFDPAGGPDWFAAKDFLLREYMPLEADMIAEIVASAPGPRVLEEAGSLPALHPRTAVRALGARRGRSGRLHFAAQLAQPRASINGSELEPDEVAVDERGMAVRFALPDGLRRQLEQKQWARVVAGLCFPLPGQVAVFPVYFPDLTREGRISFDHSGAHVSDVMTDMFFSVYRPFWRERVADDADRRIVETDEGEWIFPGAGMVFSWRNRAPGGAGTAAASMFPRP
jgi:hypothetical protein